MVSAGMAASVLNPRIPRESEQEEPIISPSSGQHHPGYKHAKAGHRKDVKMGQIGHKSSTVYQIWVTPVQFENWKKGWTRKFNPFSTALSEALYFTPFKLVDQNHIHKRCVFFLVSCLRSCLFSFGREKRWPSEWLTSFVMLVLVLMLANLGQVSGANTSLPRFSTSLFT